MAYKPILFNTEMVNAIMDGRKTVTRRIIKDFAGEEITSILQPDGSYGKYGTKGWRGMLPDRGDGNSYCIEVRPPCEPGDILWVRETWSHNGGEYRYKADDEMPDGWHTTAWRPSIHMPKEAARIFLRVKDVRVERLQSGFSKDGAAIMEFQKEGVEIGETCTECIAQYGHPCCIDPDGNTECGELDNPRYEFSRLWDTTIKHADLDKYGWSANPWVWVIEFERCEKPEGWPRCQ